MYSELIKLILLVVISFVVSLLSTRWVINVAGSRNFKGKDVNKGDSREVPLLGGIGPITGFLAGAFTLEALEPRYLRLIASIVSVVLALAFIGALDDFLNLRQSIRAFLPVFASVPLAVATIGHTTISVPFIGLVNFGLLYYIILIPAVLTITANAFNMLEGLNGLGTGQGIIMASALAYIGLTHTGVTHEAGILALSLIFSLVAFLIFNFYPAKVFPGNIGTYFIGATIGAIGIGGYMLTATAVLYLPYVLEFILKARTKFKGISFGEINRDGTLRWSKAPQSLTHVIMKAGNFKEYEIVIIIWLIEIVFAILAVILQTTIIRV
ncbi:UDP-N-acetylglucosamine--dolichyl-phosphate N-acetylglucosaminephosphotransferase [Sulfolobales archaeon HS-7]|nr:UDP-N-acetylglucosamine--dolichyl-phosphate N-acetylglucosaminephosphotransferase [Sulfolobales archaeon HS-7]